jgi:hypothetical protein
MSNCTKYWEIDLSDELHDDYNKARRDSETRVIQLNSFMPKCAEDPLLFWINSPKSGKPYHLDLRRLRDGGFAVELEPRRQHHWGGDFKGRPGLSLEIADDWRRERHPEDRNRLTYAFTLFRFLDRIDPSLADGAPAATIVSLTGLPENFPEDFREYTRSLGYSDVGPYAWLKTLVERVHRARGLVPPLWPASRCDKTPQLQDGFSIESIAALRRAFRKEACEIKAMFDEGAHLVRIGNDPRGVQCHGHLGSAWEKRENHAWLAWHITKERIPLKNNFLASGAQGLHKNNYPYQQHDGPKYLAPGMTDRGSEGIVGKLRWFHPSKQDTYIFWWLSILDTGWNGTTNSAINIDQFCFPHPQQADLAVLRSLVFDDDCDHDQRVDAHADNVANDAGQGQSTNILTMTAFKRRSGRWQNAIVNRRREYGAVRIIEYVIEKTRVLRATLQLELDKLRQQQARPLGRDARRTAELEAAVKSPWLYHVVNKIGHVGAIDITTDNENTANEVLRAVIKKHDLLTTYPELNRLTASDIRDHHIAFMFEQSGFNVIVAKLVAGHANFSSLRHYLNQRRLRAYSERTFSKFQLALFAEIESGEPIDLARMRIMIERGAITEEEARRLRDWRNRTVIGVGCSGRDSPPREISPNHKAGSFCREAICLVCWHRIVFDDSYIGIAPHFAELVFKKESMSLANWSGSVFEAVYLATEDLLTHYKDEQWRPLFNERYNDLKAGRRVTNLTQPQY